MATRMKEGRAGGAGVKGAAFTHCLPPPHTPTSRHHPLIQPLPGLIKYANEAWEQTGPSASTPCWVGGGPKTKQQHERPPYAVRWRTEPVKPVNTDWERPPVSPAAFQIKRYLTRSHKLRSLVLPDFKIKPNKITHLF